MVYFCYTYTNTKLLWYCTVLKYCNDIRLSWQDRNISNGVTAFIKISLSLRTSLKSDTEHVKFVVQIRDYEHIFQYGES